MKFKYSVLSLAILLSGQALAEQSQPWYVGARAGVTDFEDYKDNGFGGGAFLGYNVTPWLAFETGYTLLGDSNNSAGTNTEIDGFDLAAKFSADLTENLEGFAKLGGYQYDNQTGNGSKSGLTSTVGAGLEYYFNNSFSTRLEYQYYEDMAGVDAHFAGLGLIYNFGGVAPAVMPEPEPEPKPQPKPKPKPSIVTVDPVTANVYFEFDSGELTSDDVTKLQPVGKRLRQYPESKLFVIGHTDSRGSDAYNQTLSVRRAAVVAEYLEGHFGIDKSRISVEGRGESQPIATNDTDAGRAENRRVEVFTPGFSYEKK